MPDIQDALSDPHADQKKPAPPLLVGSYLEAESYFKSPYYQDSYYFPYNPDPHCRGNNYKTYDEMRDDDQVKVAISFKTDIIVNSGWQLQCARPDVDEFVTNSLKRMQEQGNLQTSFEDFLRDIQSSAYVYGFGMAEPVFKLKDGSYVYDSIRVRPPHSFRFQVSDKGDVTEVVQMSNRGEIHFDPKLFLHHVYQTEYGNPYGKSDLRGAFNAWKAKKFITKFLAIYLERFASPTVVGRYPANWDTDEVAKLHAALKTIQQTTALAIQDSAMIDFVQANKDSSETYIKSLNYYNMHIARALLVPDLLGISGEKTGGGSYALGQDQFKMFLATVEKDRQSLARKVTLRIVTPLVNANFGPGIKCDFQFVNYSMDDQVGLLKVWADVVKGNVFKPTADEINYLRKQLKFPEGPVELGNPGQAPGLPGQVAASGNPGQTGQPGPQSPGGQPGERTQAFSRPTKRRTQFLGLPVNVEIERGDVKSGVGPDGNPWSHEYMFPYGEIARTQGEDGDPVDCYLGPLGGRSGEDQVHIVHQRKRDGSFDEDKVFLGFPSREVAEQAYRDHGPEWGFGSMDTMTLEEFRNGYLASNRSFKASGRRRAFTSAERKVDFAQMERSLDSGDSELSKRAKRAASAIWRDYLKQVVDSGLVKRLDPRRLTELKPRFLKDMNVELKYGFRDILEGAYSEAKRELFPDRKFGLDEGELEFEDMMAVLDAEAFNITRDYAGLVSKKVNADIADGLKRGLSTDEIARMIRADMPDLTDTWINTLIRTKTTEVYNRGRKSYFDNDPLAQQVVKAYQYSAIIDARTTDVCLSLDKRVFMANDADINLLVPPLHFNCRSVLVPVTTYEKSDLDDAEGVPSREKLQDMGAGLLSESCETKTVTEDR